jgi:hypothetical protein
VQLPDELSVGADYGLTVVNGASPSAYKLALFILSVEGQRTLAKHGFAAPALPKLRNVSCGSNASVFFHERSFRRLPRALMSHAGTSPPSGG